MKDIYVPAAFVIEHTSDTTNSIVISYQIYRINDDLSIILSNIINSVNSPNRFATSEVYCKRRSSNGNLTRVLVHITEIAELLDDAHFKLTDLHNI